MSLKRCGLALNFNTATWFAIRQLIGMSVNIILLCDLRGLETKRIIKNMVWKFIQKLEWRAPWFDCLTKNLSGIPVTSYWQKINILRFKFQ